MSCQNSKACVWTNRTWSPTSRREVKRVHNGTGAPSITLHYHADAGGNFKTASTRVMGAEVHARSHGGGGNVFQYSTKNQKI